MTTPPLDPDAQWVVVDTDTGIDDAHSLLYLLAQPDVQILGITTVYGNCSVEDSARNVQTVLRLTGREDIPVHGGAAAPLEGEPSIAWFVHGHDGLGDRGLDRAEARLADEDAADYLVRIANEHPGRIDLHPLGPLTNIALALEKDPELFLKFRSVVIMGGAGPYPAPGEATVTDANTHNDRAAAERVFRAPNAGNVVMVGVNVTSTALLEEDVTALLLGSDRPEAVFAGTILDAYNDFYQYKWGRRISAAHDGLASVILHRPEIVTGWVEGPVDFTPAAGSLATRVALTSAGLPLVFGTPEGPSVRAVTAVDLPAFRRRFVHALAFGREGARG
ncbi:nucleoside hydrolase [Mycetocola reblochoni]|uniref:Inosine-uridine preferring nucleoside hydrolase n=1 Tax=Mycetocola reblochoni REB411 TaxID=1255698 RepID=A0A1R4IXK7_9MICO|nr:nucleoside hydrolase [Mycetocola reblochoni]SJN24570.1 Inosine-uridine preferring nucleoside hydrolase [Mycetocola reblochoni REB411]